MGLFVVVHAPEMIAVRHRRERAVERKDLQAVTSQVELPDDLRPQQRDDIGADREAKALEHLLSDRRTADEVAAFEHEHPAPGRGEICGRGQAVVAAADDDDVVLHGAILPTDLYNPDGTLDSTFEPSTFEPFVACQFAASHWLPRSSG